MFFIINLVTQRTDSYFSIDTIMIIACFLIAYNTIYIYLNYKFDYSKTHFTTYIILALMLILFKFGNEFEFLIESLNSFLLLIIVIVFSSISLFISRNHKWNI